MKINNGDYTRRKERMDKKEMMNIIYDTLMKNTDNSQLDIKK